MRIFAIVYVVIALVASVVAVFAQIFPATIVIEFITNSDGEFYIALAAAIVWLVLIIPLFLVLVLYTLIAGLKQRNENLKYDQSGIILRRDKSIYSALFPIEIVVDGKRMGSVIIGRTQQILLPNGEYNIKIKAVGKSCETVLLLAENKSPVYEIGFRKGGVMYLDNTEI
ncbi:MAG: hypothetical protein QE487_17075 [Fluviicola sp.]|nr:hypothetical protein [Fluviicola sp.]